MSRNSTRRTAPIPTGLNAATLRANDLRAAVGPNGPTAEIGRRKLPNGQTEIIRQGAPRVTYKDSAERPTGELRRRFQPSMALIQALPRPIGDAWSHYLQNSHPRANPARAAEAENAFVRQLADAARRVHELRRSGCRIADLAPQDQAIYFFASAQAAIHRVINVRYATPTILGVINVTDYGTDAEAWSDTLEGRRASLPSNSAWSSGGPGSVTMPERNQLTGLFRWSRQAWNIDQAIVAKHAEAVGREGAPTWDLLDRTVLDATAVIDADQARLVAFGSAPGTAPPAGTQIPGMLYAKSASSVSLINANGEIVYNTGRDWMIAQQTAAQYSAGLAADILVLSPSLYMTLAGQFVNSAGSQVNVIQAWLDNLPFLREVRQAREFEPLSAEQAALQAAGMSATMARRYSGGIDVAGTQKKAIAFFRDDPEVITVKRGREPFVTDNGLAAGSFTGDVAGLMGGTYLNFTEGLALGYLP